MPPTTTPPKPSVQSPTPLNASPFVSSKPLETLSTIEKKARYAALRKKLGRSRLEVVGDPAKHYFWAGIEDKNEMAVRDGIGYSIVREPNAKDVLNGTAKAKISANGLREDGTYVVGDVILMECPMEVYEFLMLDASDRHEELATGATRDFRAEAEKYAVPVFEHGQSN